MADTLTTEPIAKPWYLSKTVLSLAAGILLAVAGKVLAAFDLQLPAGITALTTEQFLTVVIPMAFALYGRLTATKTLTPSADKAEAINIGAVK